MNKHFLNEEGITLTELLAALSLFAVVSALVMTVLFNVFLNSENISDNAQLRQDANLLVSTLRSHYNQDDLEEDEFEVSLDNGNILLIDGQEVNSSMTGSIAELKLENGENSISAANQSMTVKADGTPLSINLTLKNEAGQTYNLFTTIEKPAELAIALQVFGEIEEPDPPVRSGIYTVEVPGCIDIDKGTNIEYDFGYSNHLIPNCPTDTDITITGDVFIPFHPHHNNGFEMRHNTARFNVTENLFVDWMFSIDNYHPMDVQGDAVFKGKLELKNQGKFIATNIHAVYGDHNNKGVVVVRDYTELKARESIDVAEIFEMKNHGHAEIGKNFIANTVKAVDDSTININGSASISENLLAKDRSVLNIGENLIIDGNLEMYDNVEIIVEGNARINNLILGGNSKLTIKGNLVITGDVKPDVNGNSGTLRVGGSSKGTPDWLKVLKVED